MRYDIQNILCEYGFKMHFGTFISHWTYINIIMDNCLKQTRTTLEHNVGIVYIGATVYGVIATENNTIYAY